MEMKMTKPKRDQLLIEADFLKEFDIENFSKEVGNGIPNEEGMILLLKTNNMPVSKQIFYGNFIYLKTLVMSVLDSALREGIIDEKELKDMIKFIKSHSKK